MTVAAPLGNFELHARRRGSGVTYAHECPLGTSPTATGRGGGATSQAEAGVCCLADAEPLKLNPVKSIFQKYRHSDLGNSRKIKKCIATDAVAGPGPASAFSPLSLMFTRKAADRDARERAVSGGWSRRQLALTPSQALSQASARP